MRPVKRGKIKTRGTSKGVEDQLINFRFRIEGVEKNSEAFKAVKRDINKRMRDVMVRVGEKEVLPDIKRNLGSDTFAAALKIHRERSGVFVGSTLRMKARGGKPTDPALGWFDFGGQRPRDSFRREGPHTIVNTLDRKRGLIDKRVLEGVLDEFKSKGFDVGKGA